MKIYRNGKAITITEKERLAILQEEHRKRIRYAVEDELTDCEENGWIIIGSDEEREGFILSCVDNAVEVEEIYDHSPEGYHADIPEIVREAAADAGYWKED